MRARAMLVLAAVTAGAVACGRGGASTGTGGATAAASTTGAGAGTGTGGMPASCGALAWSYVNQPCNQCMLEKCCGELTACDTGTKCGDYLACVDACASGDGACSSACEAATPSGVVDYQALLTCFNQDCSTTRECGTQVCTSEVFVVHRSCGNCLTLSCCDAWKACGGDATCAQCVTMRHPPASCAASPLVKAATSCEDQSCGMECTATICDSGLGTSIPACNYCLGQADPDGGSGGGCCAEIDACKSEMTCLGCLMSGGASAGCTGAGGDALYGAYTTCVSARCAAPCGG